MIMFTIKFHTHGKPEHIWEGYAEDEVRALAKAMDHIRRQTWCSGVQSPNTATSRAVNTIEIVRSRST